MWRRFLGFARVFEKGWWLWSGSCRRPRASAALLNMRSALVGLLRARYKPINGIGMSGSRLEAPEVQFQNILRDRFLVDAITWREDTCCCTLALWQAGLRTWCCVSARGPLYCAATTGARRCPTSPAHPIRFFAPSCGGSKGGCGARFDARAT